MKTINIVAPWHTKEAWETLMHAVCSSWGYEQAKQTLQSIGYYLAEDQYELFVKQFNVSMDLDIGDRRDEVK